MYLESKIRLVSLFFLITSFVLMWMSATGSGTLGARPPFMYLSLASALLAAGLSIYISRGQLRRHQRRIFIMYNHADQDAAADLVRKLKAEGYNPWFDLDEIAPGQKIQERIQNGLSECAVALLLVSNRLNLDSALINDELNYALARIKPDDQSFSPVIPVRLDDAEIPDVLSGVNWIDLREKNAFERLNSGLKRILAA